MRFYPEKPLEYYYHLRSLFKNGNEIVNMGGSSFALMSSRGVISVRKGAFYHNIHGPSWMEISFTHSSLRGNLFFKKMEANTFFYALFDVNGNEMPFKEWEQHPLVKIAHFSYLIKEVLDET